MPGLITNRGKRLILEKYFRSGDNYRLVLLTGTPLSISNATNASPIVITTSTPHNLSTGNKVLVFGVVGNTAANGLFTVTVQDANNFSLDGSTGSGAYVSGGTIVKSPNEDADTMADVTEIPEGNGYTAGGILLTGNATDFDILQEDDSGNRAYVQIRDLTWTASGGSIPQSGQAYFAALIDNNVTPSARQVIAVTDLIEGRVVSDGQPLTIVNFELSLDELA